MKQILNVVFVLNLQRGAIGMTGPQLPGDQVEPVNDCAQRDSGVCAAFYVIGPKLIQLLNH